MELIYVKQMELYFIESNYLLNSNQQARGKLTRDINAKVSKVKKNCTRRKTFFLFEIH